MIVWRHWIDVFYYLVSALLFYYYYLFFAWVQTVLALNLNIRTCWLLKTRVRYRKTMNHWIGISYIMKWSNRELTLRSSVVINMFFFLCCFYAYFVFHALSYYFISTLRVLWLLHTFILLETIRCWLNIIIFGCASFG